MKRCCKGASCRSRSASSAAVRICRSTSTSCRSSTWSTRRRPAPRTSSLPPPIYYGFSEHVMDFPGTMNIRPEIMIEYLFDICRSFARQGFDRIVLVNGHGSNRPICEIVARVTNETNVRYARALSLARDVLKAIRESPPGGTAHACEAETSEYLFLRPELVKHDKIEDEYAPDYRPWRLDDFTEDAGPVHFMEFWSQRSRTGTEGAPRWRPPRKGETADGSLDREVD